MHTAGPWRIHRHAATAVEGSNGMVVANCGGWSTTERDGAEVMSEQEANAKLVAAAPELLDALRMLYEETADYIRINNLGDVHHNHSMQSARDAIAKAKVR